jgi:hypothetical protein
VHRSLQKGASLEKLSPELTSTKNKGNVPYGTITTLCESPMRFGLLYAGTDDGNIHVSKDVAYTWTKISNPLPQRKWVTRVVASKFILERVYATLNGYREDDFKPYVFVSNDYGKTWNDLSANLPLEPVNVLREDPSNEQIIYVGTDNGLYVSHDGGKHYMAWQANLPRVAIHDLAIQERENEIVLGTHGRSIYIASLSSIQKYTELSNKALAVFPLDTMKYTEGLGKKGAVYDEAKERTIRIDFFTKQSGPVVMQVVFGKYKKVFECSKEVKAGFNHFDYDGSIEAAAAKLFNPKIMQAENGKYYLPKGDYRVILSQSNETVNTWLRMK